MRRGRAGLSLLMAASLLWGCQGQADTGSSESPPSNTEPAIDASALAASQGGPTASLSTVAPTAADFPATFGDEPYHPIGVPVEVPRSGFTIAVTEVRGWESLLPSHFEGHTNLPPCPESDQTEYVAIHVREEITAAGAAPDNAQGFLLGPPGDELIDRSSMRIYCPEASIEENMPLPELPRRPDEDVGTIIEGWMVFAVTPEIADGPLALVYFEHVRRANVPFRIGIVDGG